MRKGQPCRIFQSTAAQSGIFGSCLAVSEETELQVRGNFIISVGCEIGKTTGETGKPRSLLLAIGIWMCLVGTAKEMGALIFVVLPPRQSAALQMWMVTPCSSSVILAQRAELQ